MTAHTSTLARGRVPILMYHAVEDAPLAPLYKHLYVTRPEFEGQMRMLKRHGYTPITFNTLRAFQTGVEPLPKKPVVLTFDDGYANLERNAHPILAEFGFKYTVFLVSERIGGTNNWVEAEGMTPTPLLDWPAIRRLKESGHVDFQPHTVTHPHLSRISIGDARDQMHRSKSELEQRLQHAMTTFCYPYGDHNDAVVDVAGELGYESAVTTQFGRARASDHPLRLPRISVYHVPPVSLTYGIGSLNFRWRLETRKDTRPM